MCASRLWVVQSLELLVVQSLEFLGEFWVELCESFDESLEVCEESPDELDESPDPFEESDELLEPELDCPWPDASAGLAAKRIKHPASMVPMPACLRDRTRHIPDNHRRIDGDS